MGRSNFFTRAVSFALALTLITALLLYLVSLNKSSMLNTIRLPEKTAILQPDTWKFASDQEMRACQREGGTVDLDCADKLPWRELESSDKQAATAGTTRWFRNELYVLPEMVRTIRYPALFFGELESGYRVYFNGISVAHSLEPQAFPVIPLEKIRPNPERNNVLLRIENTLSPASTLARFPLSGLADYFELKKLWNVQKEDFNARPWIFVMVKYFLVLCGLLLFVFTKYKQEFLYLALTMLATVYMSLESTALFQGLFEPLSRKQLLIGSYMLTHVLLTCYVLAYFRLRLLFVIAGFVVALAISGISVREVLVASSIQELGKAFDNWLSVPFHLLSVVNIVLCVVFLYYFRTRFNIKHRIRQTVILTGALAVIYGFNYAVYKSVLFGSKNLWEHSNFADLAPLILLFAIGVIEMVLEERRRQDIEHRVLHLIDKILKSSVSDFNEYMKWVLDEARAFLKARRASLVLRDSKTGQYKVAYISGSMPSDALGSAIEPDSIAQQIMNSGTSVAIPNARYSIFHIPKLRKEYQTLSFMATPLVFQDRKFGLLCVSDPEEERSWYNHTEKHFLELFASRISNEIYKSKQFDAIRKSASEMEQVVMEANHTMEILAGAFEDHYHEEDDDTYGHAGAVLSFSKGILQAIRELDLGPSIAVGDYEADMDFNSINFEQRLTRAAYVHDVGKREVPIHVLRKPGKLDWPDEVQQMWGHGLAGYYILKGKRNPTKFNRTIALELHQIRKFGKSIWNVVNYLDKEGREMLQSLRPNYDELSQIEFRAVEAVAHQEYYNGMGYPFALRGTEIPVIGRVLCVADSIAVMKMRDIYSIPKTWEWVYFELEACSGEQFDPVIVKAAQHHLYQRIIRHLVESRKWIDAAREKGLVGKEARDFVPKVRELSKKVA